jgi:hypothetical protein
MYEKYPPLDIPDPHIYLLYDKLNQRVLLDKAAAPHIEAAITARKAPIQIAFYKGLQWSNLLDSHQTLPDYPFGHAEIWFGNNVSRVVQTEWGAFFTTLEQEKLRHDGDLITLPCKDPAVAFHIIHDLIHNPRHSRISYGMYLLKLTNHILAQLLDVDDLVEVDHPPDELDPLNPFSWKNGVFCSQLVLLCLKACVLKDAIQIDDEDRKHRFLNTYTHTCMPNDLLHLVTETWQSCTPSCAPTNLQPDTACHNSIPSHTQRRP